jgi:MarR family transcriptional regulator, transcriptional regulator for hemolysin
MYLHTEEGPMSLRRDLAFTINDVARLLRTYADQKAAQYGMSRAKWAVLARLDRFEGLKQTELADMLDLQPISLTRLLDSLCANGLIERRADPDDRRAKRLFLTPAARPLLERLGDLAEELMGTALAGLDQRDSKALLAQLSTIKDNLRRAVARRQQILVVDERYG